jgi:GT2 family glycosyltransferase
MKEKASIIIINFNGLQYLKRTLASVLELNYPDCEIIVADNGSEDGSIEYVQQISEVRLVQSPVYGSKNYAANYAVNQAQGDYILFLDNDLVLTEKEILKNLVNRYEQLDKCACLSLAYVNEGEKKTKGYGCFVSFFYSWSKPVISIEEVRKRHLSLIGTPQGACFFIKKNIWKELNGYDTFLTFGGDDDDLGMKAWMRGYKNYLYSKSIQIHIGLAERTDTKKYSEKFGKKTFAHLYTIIKNFNVINMIVSLFLYIHFNFLKSIKQSVVRLSASPLLNYIKGCFWFFKSLNVAWKKRKEIQSWRLSKKDIFLRIRPED